MWVDLISVQVEVQSVNSSADACCMFAQGWPNLVGTALLHCSINRQEAVLKTDQSLTSRVLTRKYCEHKSEACSRLL